jgi:hypothetical protein
MKKIDDHKIEHQPQNKYLLETIIPIESKQKSIIQSISQQIQILNNKIEKNKLKKLKDLKKVYLIGG